MRRILITIAAAALLVACTDGASRVQEEFILVDGGGISDGSNGPDGDRPDFAPVDGRTVDTGRDGRFVDSRPPVDTSRPDTSVDTRVMDTRNDVDTNNPPDVGGDAVCSILLECSLGCEDPQCVEDCRRLGSPTAQSQLNAVVNCAVVNDCVGDGDPVPCLSAFCGAELMACRGQTTIADLCAGACEHATNCLDNAGVCQPGIIDVAGCTDQCIQDPASVEPATILAMSCPEVADYVLQQVCSDPNGSQVCMCGNQGMNDTNAGAACTSDMDCDGGTLQPYCIPESQFDPGSGMDIETGYDGGYCIAFGCQSNEVCGLGNLCFQVDDMGTTACFDGCQTPMDCRSGYVCQDVSGDGTFRTCLPACESNADCGGATCDVQTGECDWFP